MDTINPWLDPAEVRQLAEKLIRPVEQSAIVSSDAGFDTSFVGFLDADEPAAEKATAASTTPAAAVTPTPVAAPVVTTPAPTHAPLPSAPISNLPAALSKLKPAVKVAPTPQVTTLLDSRFDKIRNWLTEEFSAKEIFILDQTGAVIFDESHHGRLHFIARDLILQANQKQNVRVKFGPSANLELIPCENPKGLVILGALFPYTLSNNKITLIREALNESLSA
jgi:hypothetical protein